MKEHCELTASFNIEEKPIRVEFWRVDDFYKVTVKDGDNEMVIKSADQRGVDEILRRTQLFLKELSKS
jgi:hypothetical protein